MSIWKWSSPLKPAGSGIRECRMNPAAFGSGRCNIGNLEVQLEFENYLSVTKGLLLLLEQGVIAQLLWTRDAPGRDLDGPWLVTVEIRGHLNRPRFRELILTLQRLGVVGKLRYTERGFDHGLWRGDVKRIIEGPSPYGRFIEVAFGQTGARCIRIIAPVVDEV